METIKLLRQTDEGNWVRTPVKVEAANGRLYFIDPPKGLRPEIKAMQGQRYHGYREPSNDPFDGTHGVWSILNSTRNNFQLEWMTGGNPYANWEKPLQKHLYTRPLKSHQCLMSDHCLTYHYKILAAEMGTGKSLSAIEVMERSGFQDWWYVAPKSGLAAVDREFTKWGLNFTPKLMTYDRLRIDMQKWESGFPAPQGVFFDESSRLKGAKSQRTNAAQWLADAVRAEYGWDGYVILMTGTPAPKAPIDWWSQCEICYPGFLKEGSVKAFEQRLGIFEKRSIDGSTFYQRKAWRDNEMRCNVCGEFEYKHVQDEDGEFYLDVDDKGEPVLHPNHDVDPIFGNDDAHTFVPSKNEVSTLYQRLDGLVLPLKLHDCWDLPDKIYREVELEPTTTLKRVAKALAAAAPSVIQGITWLRELSDGFQYSEKEDGTEKCPVCKGKGECDQWFSPDGDPIQGISTEAIINAEKRTETCQKCDGSGEVPRIIRDTREIKCPKEGAIRDLLEENEDQGRIVLFGGFTGTIDRLVRICHRQQWDVVRVDGRGWKIMRADGDMSFNKIKPLDYWADLEGRARVAFVAHPESGGMGLTLTEARMAVFYSNDFKPESRAQAEGRIHRPGVDENKGATIVDLFHLGTDRKVLNVLRDNRRLEQMTLGELRESL